MRRNITTSSATALACAHCHSTICNFLISVLSWTKTTFIDSSFECFPAQTAVKEIAFLLSRAGIDDLFGEALGAAESADRDKAKKLDVVSVGLYRHACLSDAPRQASLTTSQIKILQTCLTVI